MNSVVATLGLAVLALVSAEPVPVDRSHQDFQYVVTFGDSYTDDGRGNSYGVYGNKGPPPGVYPPETNLTSGGGLTWPQFVGNYTKATIYDYAIGGATCSNEIISRFNPFLGRSIPSVIDDQIPSFEADTNTALYKHVTEQNSVYALWIGTNDLGVNAFLTDSETAGTNLTSYVDCLWSTFDHIYKAGGRRFVILNNNALQLSPLYQDIAKGGVGNGIYWADKENYNTTEYNQKMLQYTVTANRMIDDGAPFNLLVKKRWPGARFAVYNVYGFIVDIINNPEQYLEAPYNVTGYYNDCPATGCPADRKLDSYLWFDALHPSNKTDTHIAKEFVNVATGKSKYGTYWNY